MNTFVSGGGETCVLWQAGTRAVINYPCLVVVLSQRGRGREIWFTLSLVHLKHSTNTTHYTEGLKLITCWCYYKKWLLIGGAQTSRFIVYFQLLFTMNLPCLIATPLSLYEMCFQSSCKALWVIILVQWEKPLTMFPYEIFHFKTQSWNSDLNVCLCMYVWVSSGLIRPGCLCGGPHLLNIAPAGH